MIAGIVTLSLGLLACVVVLASVVRSQGDQIVRLTAALAAPNRTAAVEVLTAHRAPADATHDTAEPRPQPLIGA